MLTVPEVPIVQPAVAWQGLELNDAIPDSGPAANGTNGTNGTGLTGTMPVPAITIPVTKPIATNCLKTDTCAGVDCSSCVGTSAAPTITLSGTAKTDDCIIAGATIDALATDRGIVEVQLPPPHILRTCQPHARRSAAATPCSEQLTVP